MYIVSGTNCFQEWFYTTMTNFPTECCMMPLFILFPFNNPCDWLRAFGVFITLTLAHFSGGLGDRKYLSKNNQFLNLFETNLLRLYVVSTSLSVLLLGAITLLNITALLILGHSIPLLTHLSR